MTELGCTVVRDLIGMLGERGVVRESPDKEKYERGYRYGAGHALAVVRPATVAELTEVVRYCFGRSLRMLPQGANTGLVGASTPDASGSQIIVSLERMRGVESVDVHNRTATVLAGTLLSGLNRQVREHGLFFPIDVGSDPSLGGMVATNTGGSRLLRYGDVQRSLLGIEVVLADAGPTVMTEVDGLRKDNSGIDLKQLFVGTSGAFGIITRVQIELQRIPRQTATALVVPTYPEAVPELLTRLETQVREFLVAFEGMSANALDAALRHNRRLRNHFSSSSLPVYAVLVELAATLPPSAVDLSELLAGVLGHAMEGPRALVVDASLGRGEDYWAIRHSISDSLRDAGSVIGFDISVPRSLLPELRADLVSALTDQCPQLIICDFGHCGDGGAHFNLLWPKERGQPDRAVVDAARELVYTRVVGGYGGSFSAEHGVGPHNIACYRRYTSAAERTLAAGIKRLFDPKGLLGAVDFS